MLIETKGLFVCSPNQKIGRVLLDQGIGYMYRWLIPRYKKVCIPRHPFHLTVIRYFEEDQVRDDVWGKHHGMVINVQYEDQIQEDDTYYWLNAYSEQVGDIREELGLPRIRDGFNCYHLTIGNKK